MALPFDWFRKRKKKTPGTDQSDPVAALKNLQGRIEQSDAEKKAAGQESWGNLIFQQVEKSSEKFNPIDRFQTVVENRQLQDQSKMDAALRENLKRIAVVAFVGPSGTGKSTRAIQVARDNHIKYLIDDGLLINGSRIVAGTSAKRAKTKIESVRQALFMDSTRAANMRRALSEHHPTTLMILGTSDSMLNKICEALWLNPPSMLIRIEDVSTEEERRLAKHTRMSAGQHTIPVPSMEIKHEFSGYFADPLGRLRKRMDRERGVVTVATESERTVVRPTFSGLGTYSMSDEAMSHMIDLIVERLPGVAEMLSCKLSKEVYGVIINIQLSLYFGHNAQDVLGRVQLLVSKLVEEYTSINVLAVNVRAIRLVKSESSASNVQKVNLREQRELSAHG